MRIAEKPCRRTWVNVPPTMTLLPIWRIALTCPSKISGVQSAGSGFTTTDSGVCTAAAGEGMNATSETTMTSPAKRGVIRWTRGSLDIDEASY